MRKSLEKSEFIDEFKYGLIFLLIYIFIPIISLLKIVNYDIICSVTFLCFLFIYSLINFVLTLLYSKKNGLTFILPIMSGLSFLFVAYIFYNESAFFYSIIYAFASIIGSLVGLLLKKVK